MVNLLSIDWDFFFPIPSRDPMFLYDWGHREAPLFLGSHMWVMRDAAFRVAGIPRPDVNNEWRTFWDTVRIAPDAELYFGESHAWAADPDVAEGVTEVWSFDAHHDGGYDRITTNQAFETGEFRCDTWMILYGQMGAKLQMRYPKWRTKSDEGKPFMPFYMNRKKIMPGEKMPVFDRVFVCRSGAWVPPWCDPKYSEFLSLCPVPLAQRHDMAYLGWPSEPRDYDPAAVEAYVTQIEGLRSMGTVTGRFSASKPALAREPRHG